MDDAVDRTELEPHDRDDVDSQCGPTKLTAFPSSQLNLIAECTLFPAAKPSQLFSHEQVELSLWQDLF